MEASTYCTAAGCSSKNRTWRKTNDRTYDRTKSHKTTNTESSSRTINTHPSIEHSSQSRDTSTNPRINEPIDQIDWAINQSINQSSIQSINDHSFDRSTNQRATQSANHSNQLIAQPKSCVGGGDGVRDKKDRHTRKTKPIKNIENRTFENLDIKIQAKTKTWKHDNMKMYTWSLYRDKGRQNVIYYYVRPSTPIQTTSQSNQVHTNPIHTNPVQTSPYFQSTPVQPQPRKLNPDPSIFSIDKEVG